MLKLNDLSDNLSINMKLLMIKCSAIIIIQKKAKIYLQKRFGVNWKTILNYKWTVEELDYYCERKEIYDPWYDYCDDPQYNYKNNDP